MFIEWAGWHFYQPIFFDAPIFGFNIEPGVHIARFSIDVGGPREVSPTRLMIELRPEGFIRRYADGAQLYRCVIKGPRQLLNYASGRCRPREDGDFDIFLFHHTNPKACDSIKNGRELRSSRWNLQGTRELANVAYVYLTSLPSIVSEADLRRIAMSSNGVVSLQTTSDRFYEKELDLKVYRESTTGRTAKLPVTVSSDLLAPPHLLVHRPMANLPYYEVIGSEIYRIGVQPGIALKYARRAVTTCAGALKRFDYLIVGDASSLDGLAAPYDEEETREVVHIEKLTDCDLFDFWLAHPNSDQFSSHRPEPRGFLS